MHVFSRLFQRRRARERTLREAAHEFENGGGARHRTGVADQAVERSGHRCRVTRTRLGVVCSEHGEMFVGQAVAGCDRDLDRPHGIGPYSSLLTGLADHAPRGISGGPSRTDGHAADHATDLVAGRPGVCEPLEHEHHRPLPGHVPALTATVEHRRRTVGERTGQRPAFIGHEVHAALAGGADHGIAGPLAEHVDGRRQGRHAGAGARVERQRATHQVERLGEPAGERAARETAGFVDERGHPFQDLLVECRHDRVGVCGRHSPGGQGRTQAPAGLRPPQSHLQLVRKVAPEQRAHDHARAGAVEARLRATGIGNRRIRRLQQHELQWVGGVDLLGRHLVPPPVVAKPADEAAQPRGRMPGPRPRRIDGTGGRPTIGGYGPDRAFTAFQPREELVERQRAWQDAPGTHDRDGIGVGTRAANARCGLPRSRHPAGNVLGQGDVDVEPADPEGVDRGAAW